MELRLFCVLVSFILLGYTVNAETITYYRVYNFNTLQPIENANVTLRNDSLSLEISGLTDVYGLIDFTSSSTASYAEYIHKAGYATRNDYLDNLTNTTYERYLPPYSNEGIIKLTFVDLTLNTHKNYCIYFSSNGRLFECHSLNDTMTLHNNLNYTIVPEINTMDLASSPQGLENALYMFIPFTFAIFIIIILVVTFILSGYYIGKSIAQRFKR